MIRFIHTADSHFGIENYGKLDQKMGVHTRLLDFDAAFQRCISYAIKHNVDFFLFCGDAYKTASPTPTQQKMFLRNLLQLHQAGIPVILIVGNHDHPLSFGKIHALDIVSDFPVDGFHVITKPRILALNTKGGPINIVGIPWPTRNTVALNTPSLSSSAVTQHIASAVATIINNLADELDPTIPAILAGHLCVSTGIFSGSEKRAVYGQDPLILPSQLARAPFDYVALGHLHRHQDLNKGNTPPIVYAGSIERLDFGERTEEKGFCDVCIQDKGKTIYTFIPASTRRFIQITVTINTTQPNQQTQTIIDELAKYDLRDAIIKIVYHLANIPDRVDLKAVQLACSQAHYVAGIHAVRTIEHKGRRHQAQLEMDFEALLAEYFKQKPEWRTNYQHLIEKIINIKNELDDFNNA